MVLNQVLQQVDVLETVRLGCDEQHASGKGYVLGRWRGGSEELVGKGLALHVVKYKPIWFMWILVNSGVEVLIYADTDRQLV